MNKYNNKIKQIFINNNVNINKLKKILETINYIYINVSYFNEINSLGNNLDPNRSKEYFLPIYSKELYSLIINNEFYDLVDLYKINNKIFFYIDYEDYSKNNFNEYTNNILLPNLKIDNNNNLIKKNVKLIININHKNIIFTKYFNSISNIKKIIITLLKSYDVLNFSSYNDITTMIYLIFNKFSDNYKDFLIELFNLFNGLNIKDVIKIIIHFLLRFKAIGDKIQSLESMNDDEIINKYKINNISKNIINTKRILTTQDLLLATSCIINENINFISKTEYCDNKYLIYNLSEITC